LPVITRFCFRCSRKLYDTNRLDEFLEDRLEREGTIETAEVAVTALPCGFASQYLFPADHPRRAAQRSRPKSARLVEGVAYLYLQGIEYAKGIRRLFSNTLSPKECLAVTPVSGIFLTSVLC
jgi:hypothetical protein